MILKAKILVSSSVYRSRNKRNGRHQTLLLGECKTDSRYPEKWPESLKELEKSGQKVFIPFPKPAKDLAKCKRWLVTCSREFFTEKNVNKNKVKTCKR